MRPVPILVSGSVVLAVSHVAGVLVARPLWRYSELACLALLLAAALTARETRALAAALVVLVVEAARTIPPDEVSYGWLVVSPEQLPSPFESSLRACLAPLLAMAVLLVWPGTRRPAPLWAAVAVLPVGYAVVRVHDVGTGTEAVLPPLALALAAAGLAAMLGGRGRRLAATGAAVVALLALPLIDAGLGAVPLPPHAGEATALFTWYAITPTPALPQPMPAISAAIELTGVVLLAWGLTRRPHHDQPAPDRDG